MTDQDGLVSRAARLGDARLEWNEIDFVGWTEFRRMAPTVVGLEIGRLERLMAECEVGTDTYNTLVRSRFALRRFVEGIEQSEKNTAARRSEHLEEALLTLSAAHETADDARAEILRYIAHRLTYIHNRLGLIY